MVINHSVFSDTISEGSRVMKYQFLFKLHTDIPMMDFIVTKVRQKEKWMWFVINLNDCFRWDVHSLKG